MSFTCQKLLQAHFIHDGIEDAFIMEDRRSQKYVAMVESVGRSLTAMKVNEVSTKEGKLVRVTMTGVLNPDTPLHDIV
jgi:hypothetical protein